MAEVPAATPLTRPVVETTVATVVVPLVHVPALVASLSVVVKPAQTLVVPVITAGKGFTVTAIVLTQPVASA